LIGDLGLTPPGYDLAPLAGLEDDSTLTGGTIRLEKADLRARSIPPMHLLGGLWGCLREVENRSEAGNAQANDDSHNAGRAQERE
jgi:hypothetical protein